MKIRIDEVWNYEQRVEKLTVIETANNPVVAVWQWINAHRPDLTQAGLFDHGFNAREIN